MKKHNLLKVLGIVFLITVVLSWIVPLGAFDGKTFSSEGTSPIGIIDMFRMPIINFPTFISYGLLILMIGAMYGVLNKTGVYQKIVNNTVKRWKGKERTYLVIVMVLFALLSSLTGLSTLLFVFVPFVAAVLLLMEFPRVVALASTIGSILVGAIGSTFGFSGSGYTINILELTITNYIWVKVLLFVLVMVVFVLFILSKVKKTMKVTRKSPVKKETKALKKDEKVVTEREVKIDVPLYNEVKEVKKNTVPLIVIGVIFFIIAVVGMYNWHYSFGVSFFEEMHAKIMEFTVNGYPLFANLIGNLTQLGFWGTYELIMWLLIFTILVAWIYNVKFNDILDGMAKGAKEMLSVALYAMLASVVFTAMMNLSENMSIAGTLAGYFGSLSEKFNLFYASLMGIISPLFYNDYYYSINMVASNVANFQAAFIPIAGILLQSLFGLFMLFLPTSALLVAGLDYFKVSYKEWMKYIWLFAVIIFVLIIAFVGITALIV